ncbi:MAG TPA: hypothetical protein VLV78_15775 [Thermoanaerobaculia bacterium]|nr:hypothetical protein [Thermoanaerobaculia bacterium]
MSSAIAGTLEGMAAPRRGRWIESVRFDLLFLILPPLLLLPVGIAMEHRIYRVMIIGVLLAFPHYFSSLTFYFWDERRDYYRERWLAFYAGPLILGAVFLLMIFLKVPLIVQVVLFFWNTFHVARQNCGLLSVYRHGAGVTDARHRNAANFAIISVSASLALANITTHQQVWPVLSVHPKLPMLVWTAAGAVAIISLARLALSIGERIREGRGPELPEAAFLCTSLLMFHPYAWMADSAMATFVMLLPHYVQYLGFVWLVHRRKFPQPAGSVSQTILGKLSSNTRFLLPVLLAIGVAFWVGNSLSRRHGFFPQFESLYLFIAFQHFYMDGLFWSLRRPEIRNSIGPYLMRRQAPAVATT